MNLGVMRNLDNQLTSRAQQHINQHPNRHKRINSQVQQTKHYYADDISTKRNIFLKKSLMLPQSYKSLNFTLENLENKVKNAQTLLKLQTNKRTCPQNSRKHHFQQKNFFNKNILSIAETTTTKNMLSSNKFQNHNFNLTSPPLKKRKYYISQLTRAVNEKNSLAIEHVNSSIEILKICRNQSMPTEFQLQSRKITLDKAIKHRNKKTLILDLDETLIHCYEKYEPKADVNLSFKANARQIVEISVNIRPYALSFLKKMSKRFQIIVFTASHSNYANTIIDYLDPNRQYIAHCLYRQHCIALENGIHVKDLRLINRPLSDMILVDNAAYSYAFQLENGIPIIPYYDGKDSQLLALQNYLSDIDKYSDVRQCNKESFKLQHYIKFDNAVELIEQLYMPHKL